jgi:hypothetical protein
MFEIKHDLIEPLRMRLPLAIAAALGAVGGVGLYISVQNGVAWEPFSAPAIVQPADSPKVFAVDEAPPPEVFVETAAPVTPEAEPSLAPAPSRWTPPPAPEPSPAQAVAAAEPGGVTNALPPVEATPTAQTQPVPPLESFPDAGPKNRPGTGSPETVTAVSATDESADPGTGSAADDEKAAEQPAATPPVDGEGKARGKSAQAPGQVKKAEPKKDSAPGHGPHPGR